jgi:putative ABC transport system substrate-binding protein
MKRREFIAGIGTAAVWPAAVRAQQPIGQKRVAILMGSADDADGQERLSAFRRGLQDLHWVEGRNIRFDVRWVPAMRREPGRMPPNWSTLRRT